MAKLNGKNFTLIAKCETAVETTEDGWQTKVCFALRSDGQVLKAIKVKGPDKGSTWSGSFGLWVRLGKATPVTLDEAKLRGVCERRGYVLA